MAERAEVTRKAETAAAVESVPPRSGIGKKSGGKAGKKKMWRETPAGRLLELLAYLIMLVMVLVYFTGKGLFIYEGF